jgi:hypothetical protein
MSEERPQIDREADRAWDRVRELDERVARLERIDPDDLSDEARRRLDSARARRKRAADRALLADELADQLAELASEKRRGSERQH